MILAVALEGTGGRFLRPGGREGRGKASCMLGGAQGGLYRRREAATVVAVAGTRGGKQRERGREEGRSEGEREGVGELIPSSRRSAAACIS
jgi:hypothetical protein